MECILDVVILGVEHKLSTVIMTLMIREYFARVNDSPQGNSECFSKHQGAGVYSILDGINLINDPIHSVDWR